MDIFTAMKNRHSVRSYIDKAIDGETLAELSAEIDACNNEGELHIQLITNEPTAFEGMRAHYGKFSGVQNYIALVGRKSTNFDEKSGYYGQRIALKAQMLGLNTCWVALTFNKGAAKKAIAISKGEKLGCVLALGYGKTQGTAHNSKPMTALCKTTGNVPKWFEDGMEAAMLAPTAMNQQKFLLTYTEGKMAVNSTGGLYAQVDLGIVKYHTEIGSGRKL